MASRAWRWKAPPLISRRSCAMRSKRSTGWAAFPGRWPVYYRRHPAHNLSGLGGKLPGTGHRSVPRLSAEDHVSPSLPRRPGGQYSEEHGVAASACRLLFRGAADAREIGVERQMPWAFRVGAGTHMDLLGHERLAAFGADHHRIEILAAEIVSVQQRAPFLAGHMAIAPVNNRHDDRVEVEPFLRQAVLITQRPLLVGHFDEHKLVDQLLEPVGEDRASDAEALLEILKAPHAQKAIP